MNRSSLKIAAGGPALALALLAGSGLASAHGGKGVSGTIAQVSNTQLQVQTATGIQTFTLSATRTHVLRVTTGSSKDLAPNQRVSFQLARGTTSVTSVRIEPAPSATKPVKAGKTGKTHAGATKTPTIHKGTGTHARTHAQGVIYSVNGNQVTLTGRNGAHTTYTLSPTVAVTIISAAALTDLATSQHVQVFARNGTAYSVTITG